MAQAKSNTPTLSEVTQDERQSKSLVIMENIGNLKDMNREFDVTFWQAQDAAVRFQAAWEQVEFYYSLKGLPKDELRLQRSVETLRRQSG